MSSALPHAAARSLFCLLALLAAICAPQALAAEEGRYIVVFNDFVKQPGAIARAQVKEHDGRLGFIYNVGLKGFSATLPRDQVEALRRDPRVKAVRPDHVVIPAVQSIPTGIKRVLASTNPMLHIDEEDNFKVDADVAVIDTGVAKHSTSTSSNRSTATKKAWNRNAKKKPALTKSAMALMSPARSGRSTMPKEWSE